MKRTDRKKTYTVGSLFAGIGGFCRAFKNTGFDIKWSNDSDSFACTTYRHNYPDIRLIEKSIEKLSVVSDKLEQVDVLIAGFPCQPFSVAGSRQGFNDPRGKTFFEITRLVREFGDRKPKILLLENVSHLLNHDKGRTFRRMIDEIQGAGYWFAENNVGNLNTHVHTEIPQIRQRIFMVAVAIDGFRNNAFDFPSVHEHTELLSKYLDLDKKQSDWHYFDENSRWSKLFVEAMETGDPDATYQLRRYYVREIKRKLVPTLTANMGDGGHNQPVIKDRWGIRKFTVAECLRLQGFDDSFEFPEDLSLTQQYKQIGNSVTVSLVEKLAHECGRLLKTSKQI